MNLLDPNRLSTTLDRIGACLLDGREMPSDELKKAAAWIASRQGQTGSYAGMFAPTPEDYRDGIRLFTGERIASRAGIGHVLGEDALRILKRLPLQNAEFENAVQSACKSFKQYIDELIERGYGADYYCCGQCSVVFWRTLSTGWLPDYEERLHGGMQRLKAHRIGQGKWRRHPFHSTCLALLEIGPDLAGEEMRYARASCERIAKKKPGEDEYARRRVRIAERILEVV